MFNLKNTIVMRKKSLFMVVAGIVLAMANSPTTSAQEAVSVATSLTSTLPITGVSESTDGNYNFKNFEVKVSEAGSYYTEFWLLPSKYSNNCYTTFLVYVNEDYIGSITPMSGNWQSARVNGNETLEFEEGVNVVTIATRAPEFPEVETLKAALNDSEATFSSNAYEEYLDEVSFGTSYDIPEEDGISLYAANAASVGIVHYTNVPLNYTFYKTFSFTQGQQIFISSSSYATHKIDVIYYGSEPSNIFIPNLPNEAGGAGLLPNRTTSSIPDLGEPETAIPNIKVHRIYTPATSEEMQGLGWVYPSEKTINSSIQVATARLSIPKTGQYLVRVRHAQNGNAAFADVNVNGVYYYENVPITLSLVNCEIPADGNNYATMTCCNNFGKDDPYLFIHGAHCDKIVGFNDDSPRAKTEQYNLSSLDSYISQTYFMTTSGISVNNYSSLNPQSRCNILARVSEESAKSIAKSRAKATDTAGVSIPLIMDESVNITGPDNINGFISISANEKIQRVSLYNLAGYYIGSVNGGDSCIVISTSMLNITQPGIYVVNVETTNGMTSKKVAVK